MIKPVSVAVKTATRDSVRTETPAQARPDPQPATPASPPQVAAPAEPVQEEAAAPAKPKLAAPAPRAARREVLAARSAPPAPARTAAPVAAAGTLQLAILPWGEVFVNGKSRGVSPPLRSVEVPPGTYTVEVRNTSFPTHTRRVEVRAGEPVRIRHRFR